MQRERESEKKKRRVWEHAEPIKRRLALVRLATCTQGELKNDDQDALQGTGHKDWESEESDGRVKQFPTFKGRSEPALGLSLSTRHQSYTSKRSP